MFFYTRKQAGVIYKAWKRGELSISMETINIMYEYADAGMVHASDPRGDWMNETVGKALDHILGSRSMARAQREFDFYEAIRQRGFEGRECLEAHRAYAVEKYGEKALMFA